MSITVQIPAPLRQHVGGQAAVAVAGASVKEALAALAAAHPALAERIMDGGKVRQFVNVFVNDEDIRYLEALDTALSDGDTVSIIPAVAGG